MTTTLVSLKTPLSVVTSSFLAARSTASSFRLAAPRHTRGPPVATAVRPWCCKNPSRTALQRSCPPGAGLSRTGFPRFEPVAGLLGPQNGLPHLCRRFALSRDPAPAVSDRMDFQKPPEVLGAQRNT